MVSPEKASLGSCREYHRWFSSIKVEFTIIMW